MMLPTAITIQPDRRCRRMEISTNHYLVAKTLQLRAAGMNVTLAQVEVQLYNVLYGKECNVIGTSILADEARFVSRNGELQ